MSNTKVISAKDNLIDTVASLLNVTKPDLSNQIVVFPGKRPAHFLRKKISELIGSSYIPPKIFSMDSFISHLNSNKLNLNLRVIDPLDAVIILFDIHKKLNERIGGDKFLLLDHFMPLGMKIFSELEELMFADIDVKNLKSLIEGIPYGKLNLLWKYYENFYCNINSIGYTTRALQYANISRQIEHNDLSEYKQIILAGFFVLTPVEKKIFNSIRMYPNSIFVYQQATRNESQPPDTEAEDIQNSNIIKTEQPEISFIRSPDTHGQVLALNSLLKKEWTDGKYFDERTVIVLPNEATLFPLLNEVLSEKPENDYNIALGYPLARTPVFRFISALTELVSTMKEGKIQASEYVKFVLHPYAKNIYLNDKSEITRMLFHTLERFIAEDQSKTQFTLEEIENWTVLFEAVANSASSTNELISKDDLQKHLITIHNKTIRLLLNTDTIGIYANKCRDILTYIYENSTANLHPLFRKYAERLIEVFEVIESSLLRDTRFEEQFSYLNLLKQYVSVQDVPFSGTPLKGLQVLGLLETRNLHFENVYILDVNEGVLPPGRGDDMLLPQPLRSMLGMETYHHREKLVEYYFDLLLNGAKRVYIFYIETNTSEKERSRFVQKLIWEKEKEAKKVIPDNTIASVRYHMRLTNDVPAPIPKTSEMVLYLSNLEYSATKLDTYLKCPIKFYYQYVLRLKEKDKIVEELDNAVVGSIVHTILHELFMPFVGKVMLATDIQKLQVKDIVKREFHRQYGNTLTGSQNLIYKQVLHQIEKLISQYQIPLIKSEEIIITGLEEEFQTYDNDTILSAKCDRIERRGDKIHIIDYKTSSDNKRYKINWKNFDLKQRQSWNESIGSLQLPLYLLVYVLCKEENKANVISEYLILGNNKISSDIEKPLFESEIELNERFPILIEVIRKLICEIKDEKEKFVPSQKLSSVCKYCQYTNLCGTSWVK